MSNFARGFRHAKAVRVIGCGRVHPNGRGHDRKSESPRRLRERSETDFPPASPQTEDANRPYDHDPEP